MASFTRLIFALFGIAFALLFAAAVLFWLVVYVVFASVRLLVTGQKPQVLMMWHQVQTMRKGMQTGQRSRWTSWTSWSRSSDGQWHKSHAHTQQWDSKTEVVEDAVVREIHDQRRLPKD